MGSVVFTGSDANRISRAVKRIEGQSLTQFAMPPIAFRPVGIPVYVRIGAEVTSGSGSGSGLSLFDFGGPDDPNDPAGNDTAEPNFGDEFASGSGDSGSGSGGNAGECFRRYYAGTIIYWNSANRCFVDGMPCWILELGNNVLASGTPYRGDVLQSPFTYQNQDRPLVSVSLNMPGVIDGNSGDSGASGESGEADCETTNSITLEECRLDSEGNQIIDTIVITLPVNVRVCRTPGQP